MFLKALHPKMSATDVSIYGRLKACTQHVALLLSCVDALSCSSLQDEAMSAGHAYLHVAGPLV